MTPRAPLAPPAGSLWVHVKIIGAATPSLWFEAKASVPPHRVEEWKQAAAAKILEAVKTAFETINLELDEEQTP